MNINYAAVANSSNPFIRQLDSSFAKGGRHPSVSRAKLVYSVAYNFFSSLTSVTKSVFTNHSRNFSYAKTYMHLSYLSLRASILPSSTMYRTKHKIFERYLNSITNGTNDSTYDTACYGSRPIIANPNEHYMYAVAHFIEYASAEIGNPTCDLLENHCLQNTSREAAQQHAADVGNIPCLRFISRIRDDVRLPNLLRIKLGEMHTRYVNKAESYLPKEVKEYDMAGVKKRVIPELVSLLQKLGDSADIRLDRANNTITVLPGKTSEIFDVLHWLVHSFNEAELTDEKAETLLKIAPKIYEVDLAYGNILFSKLQKWYNKTYSEKFLELYITTKIRNDNAQLRLIVVYSIEKHARGQGSISSNLVRLAFDRLTETSRSQVISQFISREIAKPLASPSLFESFAQNLTVDEEGRELLTRFLPYFDQCFKDRRTPWVRANLQGVSLFQGVSTAISHISNGVKKHLHLYSPQEKFSLLKALPKTLISELTPPYTHAVTFLEDKDECFQALTKPFLKSLVEDNPGFLAARPEETKELFIQGDRLRQDYQEELFKLLKSLLDTNNIAGFKEVLLECSGNKFVVSDLKASFQPAVNAFATLVEEWEGKDQEVREETVFGLLDLCPIDKTMQEASYLNLPKARIAQDTLISLIEETIENEEFLKTNRQRIERNLCDFIESLPMHEVDEQDTTCTKIMEYLDYSRKYNFPTLFETCMTKASSEEGMVLFLDRLKRNSTPQMFEETVRQLTETIEVNDFEGKVFKVHEKADDPAFAPGYIYGDQLRQNRNKRRELRHEITAGVGQLLLLVILRGRVEGTKLGEAIEKVLENNKVNIRKCLTQTVFSRLSDNNKEQFKTLMRNEQAYLTTLGVPAL
ncbi:MAG: hypothetical protein S4CHLAM37_03530 [Chlamydiia bacterium]|nr:hypothetical protein [Chlamydiia bacterium]